MNKWGDWRSFQTLLERGQVYYTLEIVLVNFEIFEPKNNLRGCLIRWDIFFRVHRELMKPALACNKKDVKKQSELYNSYSCSSRVTHWNRVRFIFRRFYFLGKTRLCSVLCLCRLFSYYINGRYQYKGREFRADWNTNEDRSMSCQKERIEKKTEIFPLVSTVRKTNYKRKSFRTLTLWAVSS